MEKIRVLRREVVLSDTMRHAQVIREVVVVVVEEEVEPRPQFAMDPRTILIVAV